MDLKAVRKDWYLYMNISKNSIYVQFYRYIPKALKRRIYILIPFLSLTGLLEVVSLAALIPLMSFILEPDNNSAYIIDLLQLNDLSNSNKITLLFGVYLFLMMLKGIFVFLTSRFAFNTSLKIRANIQQRLFKMYLNRDFMRHLESNTAHYIRNITTECNQIEGRLIMPAITLLAEILPIVFIVSFLLFINPYGVLLAGLSFVVIGLLITKFTSKYLKLYGKQQLKSDGLQVKIAKEAFDAHKEISLYAKEDKLFNIYEEHTNASISSLGKALALGQIPKLILEVVGLIVIAIIASVSLANGLETNQIIVELTVFIGAIVKLLPSTNRVVMNFQSLTHAKPAVENILMELEGAEVAVQKNTNQVIEEYDKLETVQCQNITVKYRNRDNFVLQNARINLSKNNIIGLKGESGSGKSTLINVLLGFIKPSKGSVIVNNEFNIENNLPLWQSKIGYVPQDVILFDDTLRNNILFYNEDIDNKTFLKIVSLLKLDDLIQNLPNGLDTYIGENGASLSGGQKQRVGIARALVRRPELIILDEATSALDFDTEKCVNKALELIKASAMILIIAHKDSAFEICNRVYTIKDKSVFK